MDAAKELFARQGFEGTTTRQIAERARVNEAIIFRHFPSKEDLYWAISEYIPRETRDYVPLMLAAGYIGKDPESHGFRGLEYQGPLEFEEPERLLHAADMRMYEEKARHHPGREPAAGLAVS